MLLTPDQESVRDAVRAPAPCSIQAQAQAQAGGKEIAS